MSDHDEQSTALVIPEDAVVKIVPADQLPDLDSMEEGMSLAPQYREFKEGESVRAVFCGFSEMQSQNRDDQQTGKVIPMGIFQSSDGVWVNAGANLVQQVKNVPTGTPLQVTFRGKEKTKGGFYVNTFEVRLLKQSDPNAPAPPATQSSFASASSAPASQPAQAPPHMPASPAGERVDAGTVRMVQAVANSRSPKPNLDGIAQEFFKKNLADCTKGEAMALLEYLKSI